MGTTQCDQGSHPSWTFQLPPSPPSSAGTQMKFRSPVSPAAGPQQRLGAIWSPPLSRPSLAVTLNQLRGIVHDHDHWSLITFGDIIITFVFTGLLQWRPRQQGLSVDKRLEMDTSRWRWPKGKKCPSSEPRKTCWNLSLHSPHLEHQYVWYNMCPYCSTLSWINKIGWWNFIFMVGKIGENRVLKNRLGTAEGVLKSKSCWK